MYLNGCVWRCFMPMKRDEDFIKEAEQNLARVKSQLNPDFDLVKWYERRIETLKKSAKAWADAYGDPDDVATVTITVHPKEKEI